jgi:hypothetical protein
MFDIDHNNYGNYDDDDGLDWDEDSKENTPQEDEEEEAKKPLYGMMGYAQHLAKQVSPEEEMRVVKELNDVVRDLEPFTMDKIQLYEKEFQKIIDTIPRV